MKLIDLIFEDYKNEDNNISLIDLISALSALSDENASSKRAAIFLLYATEENKGKSSYKMSKNN